MHVMETLHTRREDNILCCCSQLQLRECPNTSLYTNDLTQFLLNFTTQCALEGWKDLFLFICFWHWWIFILLLIANDFFVCFKNKISLCTKNTYNRKESGSMGKIVGKDESFCCIWMLWMQLRHSHICSCSRRLWLVYCLVCLWIQ